MAAIIARVLTVLSPLWLALHLFWLHHGHREEVLDQFLRSHELDDAAGAAVAFAGTFVVPFFAVIATAVFWRRERSGNARALLGVALGAFVVGVIVYFALPSFESELERMIREQGKAQN